MRSLLRLWPYVRPLAPRLFGSMAVAVGASCMALLIPLVLKWTVDGPVAHRDPGGVWLGGGLVLLLGLLEAGLFGLRRWLTARPMAALEARMRADLYRHLQRLPVAFHDRWGSGQLLSRATGDLQILRMFLAFPLVFLVVNSATILVGFTILLTQRWTLGLILLVPAVPLIVLCTYFMGQYSLASRRAQDQIGDLTTLVEESALGIRIIKAFGRHRSQGQAFRRAAHALLGTELRKARLLAEVWLLVTAVPDVALGVALVIGAVQVSDGQLSAGTLVAFLSTALALRWPIESLGWLLSMSSESATAADRYFEVMDTELPPDHTAGPDAVSRAGDGIRFTGVQFRYPDAPDGTPDLLAGLDLHIPTGQTLALVGATGSGKTSLTALIPRLYEATGGRITLDGMDIARLPKERLRAMVSTAFEEPTLFSASVRDNVLMGAEQAGEADLRWALQTAQCGFVHELPQGVDTQVGEQGLSLSGGQRQRLALARAVVGRPRFLVLDDPLSALDVHTEALVEGALREVLATTTALVVAHRPSTVLLADRVALLSGGRIAAVGTHHQLLAECREYRQLMSGDADDRSAA
ncbi:ABC transporter ATP-binding protein [Streptantibioticus rubrisoli]|uniref:ABC transporter ATP-binding protein n=1 Tax=Streptantibioticus rubrisoli TaxID=1387313 RepID=UPI0035575E91